MTLVHMNSPRAWTLGGKLAAVGTTAALALSLSPVAAWAVEPATATTTVYLQADDSQLSVTAPAEIKFAMKADGTFIAPDAATTTITNNSIIKVAVKSFSVTDESNMKGVTKANFDSDTTSSNVWWGEIKAGSGSAIPLSVSQTSLGTEWNMKKTGEEGSVLNLTTSGAMKSINNNVDLSAQTALAQVVWTFGAAQNA